MDRQTDRMTHGLGEAPAQNVGQRGPQQARSRATRRQLLDAAIDELVERGYAGFTTSGVARRAGVSRGAQQGHFANKDALLCEAVAELTQLQLRELERVTKRASATPRVISQTLDLIYEQYRGPHLLATVEMALAGRHQFDLQLQVAQGERDVSVALDEIGRRLLSPQAPRLGRRQAQTWALVLSAIRGLALLGLLGWPSDVIDDRWRTTRKDLLALLEASAGPPALSR